LSFVSSRFDGAKVQLFFNPTRKLKTFFKKIHKKKRIKT